MSKVSLDKKKTKKIWKSIKNIVKGDKKGN
jgi:hypothetical protein